MPTTEQGNLPGLAPSPGLPTAPLVRCAGGVSALARAVGVDRIAIYRKPMLDVFTADRWAVILGYHPIDVWGTDAWLDALNDRASAA